MFAYNTIEQANTAASAAGGKTPATADAVAPAAAIAAAGGWAIDGIGQDPGDRET